MATPARGIVGKKGGSTKTPFVAKALKVLSNPEIQAEILKHGRVAVDAVQQWRARRSERDGPSVAEQITERFGGRFGQKGLERREGNLRAAVTALSGDSPTLATSLGPVIKSLDDVSRLLEVAAALPFRKRKKAHMKIDDILDDLEAGLFDDVLQRVRTTPIED